MSAISSSVGSFSFLRYRDFSRLTLNQCCLTQAILIQEILIAYALYQLTKNPISLGLVGVVEFIPFVCFSIFGGYIADRFNRQKILQWSFSCSIPLALALWLIFYAQHQHNLSTPFFLAFTYSILFLLGCIRGIYSPCFNSLRPFLIAREHYSQAATWTALCWQINAILAPIFAGLLIARVGINGTFAVTVALFILGSWALWQMQARHFPALQHHSMISSLKEATDFIQQKPMLFWAIFLDLSSVFFGGILALLPIFSSEILHLGADGFGVLRAAPAVGSLLTMSFLVKFPPQQHIWRTLLIAVFGFACCTLMFTQVRHLYSAIIVLLMMGACDSISIVIRQTLLQWIPPKAMLGRVAAINGIFVTSGNELGALQSSIMARYFTIIPAMLIGGSLSLLSVGLTYARTRNLLQFTLKPESNDSSVS
ncbi:MFS transporter [Acinetobacter sp. MD2(2019)]|uniref:MFS transporter n=1 Tax=Acinetobacter sp. MD2(2019) TaxID=2605273 RepID=UPI002D1EF959|nr:MFS transporter [Acinetobacter sp. MD2(2019)]MEB3754444.1 MFS transporter [Acinetobacter sp. MD2(2019)]